MFDTLRNLLALPANAIACQRHRKRAGREPQTHAYAQHGDTALQLDLYMPDTKRPRVAVIVFLHGGGWSAGDRTMIEPVALDQVARGFALASVDYRLSGQAVWPAQIEDGRTAMRWLRANAQECGLDPDRMIAFGVSAGGHLAAMLGTAGDDDGAGDIPARPDGVVALYPPTDFVRAAAIGPHSMQAQAQASPHAKLIGAPITEAVEAVQSANPAAFVDGTEPPFLLLHGSADCLVDPGQSALLATALEAAGSHVRLVNAPGLVHADARFNRPPWRQEIERFLDEVTGTPGRRHPGA